MTYSLATLLNARAITDLHAAATEAWHRTPLPAAQTDTFMGTVRAQHAANFELWHLEDEARVPKARDHRIVEIKRGIDRVNQRRNDLIERCDTLLLDSLVAHNLPAPDAPLHSETPGLIIDRLSILALKIFHTRQETERSNAPEGHAARNCQRLLLLTEQRSDLAACLDQLWSQIVQGERRFKLYRQLKMYNDPSLNPAVYGKAS